MKKLIVAVLLALWAIPAFSFSLDDGIDLSDDYWMSPFGDNFTNQ